MSSEIAETKCGQRDNHKKQNNTSPWMQRQGLNREENADPLPPCSFITVRAGQLTVQPLDLGAG